MAQHHASLKLRNLPILQYPLKPDAQNVQIGSINFPHRLAATPGRSFRMPDFSPISNSLTNVAWRTTGEIYCCAWFDW